MVQVVCLEMHDAIWSDAYHQGRENREPLTLGFHREKPFVASGGTGFIRSPVVVFMCRLYFQRPCPHATIHPF